MSVDYLNAIISIFLHRDVNELSDNDLSTAIGGKGMVCSAEEIHRVVQTIGSSLFQFRCNKEGIFIVRIEPKINICREFLAGKCSFKSGGCNQLHICRFFGHCRKKDCHFPHYLNGKNNRHIIVQSNCRSVDPFLLIPLIQLYNRLSHHSVQNSPITAPVVSKQTNMASSSVQPKPVQRVFERTDLTRSERKSRDNIIQSTSLSSTMNTKCQIDISFPLISNASHITIETIEGFLKLQGLSIEKKFNPKINENFQRWTLQFEENDAVKDLRTKSIIPYKGVHLKFKRTNPMIDSKCFVLKSTIDSKKGPIIIEKFSSYIDILINHCSYKLIDLSSPVEQILLIECNKIMNFDQVHRVQKSRRQVQGRDISLKQIYEIETVIIESIQTSLSPAIVQNIIESIYENVFTFTVVSNQTTFVEFIHTDALKQWLAISDATKQKFNVDIKPSIKYVDEDTSHRPSTSQSIKPKEDNTTSQVTINLNRQWAMVAGHPKFSIEYKNYIRSEIGFEIDIRGNRVQIHCIPTSDAFPKDPSSLLSNRTNNFMQKFTFRSISLQQPTEQLAILRAHSSIVAFRSNRRKTYLLAAKNSNIEDLMQKLLPEKPIINHPPSAASIAQASTKPVDQKQKSTFVIPPPLINSISTDDKTLTSDEILTKRMTLQIDTPAQIALFDDKTFENCVQIYINGIYHTKFNIEPKIGNSRHRIVKIVGRQSSIDDTFKELSTLISLSRTKTFDQIPDYNWVKISDATRVIQHQFNLHNIICVCQRQTSPISILLVVHYIDDKHSKLGVSEQVVETLCRKRLILSTCKSMGFEKEWSMLKTKILKRDDYGKDICLFDEQQMITLYGLPHVVKDVQQQFEFINKTAERLHHALPTVVKSESIKSEKFHNLNFEKPIRSREFITYHGNNQITQKPQTPSIVFVIDEPGFEVLINQDYNRLLAIIDSKCSLEKQIIHHHIQIEMPKAKVYEVDDNTSNNSEPPIESKEESTNSTGNWFLNLFRRNEPKTQPPNPTSQVPSTSSVTIGKSKIIVCTGDLTKQAVDLIVVCSTSKILCDTITSAAGSQVKNEYNQQSSYGIQAFETTGGDLPCKGIIFRPWIYDKNGFQDLKQSIDTFVASIITHAVRHKLTTIAFPSIGCGQLGHDPKLIAEYMISETYRELKILIQSQLIVSFVLLPEQKNVHDAFVNQLSMMKNIDDIPITTISFDKQTVRITLTSSNDNVLIECQNKIKELARSCSYKHHLTDRIDWPQTTIQKYYEYCLQKRVIPKLDIENSILDLIGIKDAVSEAEKYYFQLTTETLRNARIQIISRGFVWSVELSLNKCEEYSYKINEQIENAQIKNLPYVDFMNEKSERCRVIFSNMEEQYQQRKRRVCRKRIDSILPNYWDSSSGNFKRVVLSNSSKEYKDVQYRFDITMRGQYSKVIKIERIQNERWYKQYAAHHDEFTQRYKQPDEQLLFHGCNSTSADKIVHECFNRSFAGVNGVVYGCGVYFHEHAKYSHNYTKQDVSGERTMFLARVLIGKKCVGNSTMKVPPQGFDTTTDGGHIFVVYHDAAAYGEYLILYK